MKSKDTSSEPKSFNSFREFYPFYLSQHKNPVNILLHYIGTLIGYVFLVCGIFSLSFKTLLFGHIFAYALAWIGHFYFEKNKPATFNHPLYSYMGDHRMFYDITCRLVQGKKYSEHEI